MLDKEKPGDASLKARVVSAALKHPRLVSVPLIAIETGVAALKGGEDMAGIVAGSGALTLMLSGLFRRGWWGYAYAVGAAGYIAEQPLVPTAAGVAIVLDILSHVGHTKTGIGEHDGGPMGH